MAHIPHDALFRHTFQQPEHAAALFRWLLQPAIRRAIDWTTLRLCDGTFVDRRLARQQTDLLFSVCLGGRGAYLYLVLDHKSHSDRWTALQMLGYVVAVWKSLRRQRRGRRRRLPPVLPIVLHHGRRGWSAATELGDLIDTGGLSAEVQGEVLPWQPKFRYQVRSLVGASQVELRGLALTVLGKVTLAALQLLPGAPPAQILQGIGQWADLLVEVLRAPSGEEAIAALSRYVFQATTVEPERLIEVVASTVGAEVSMKIKSAAAQLHARGKAEGKAEGLTEGSQVGRSVLLLRLLQARFGPLPAVLAERVRAADAEQLDQWAVRCLDAPSLGVVFGDG